MVLGGTENMGREGMGWDGIGYGLWIMVGYESFGRDGGMGASSG